MIYTKKYLYGGEVQVKFGSCRDHMVPKITKAPLGMIYKSLPNGEILLWLFHFGFSTLLWSRNLKSEM
jgi:hypothetical protein